MKTKIDWQNISFIIVFFVFFLGATAEVMASGWGGPFVSNYQSNDCVMCSLYGSSQYPLQNNYYYPQPTSYSPYMNMPTAPWWSTYGSMSYPNYQYPAAWSNYGVNGNMYAGHGGGFAGKPNLYITAPKGAEFTIRVNASEESNLILTVPSHGSTGWAVKSTGEKISVDNTEYDYLFYDIRFDENLFSDESGFCGKRDFIMSEMLSTLKKLAFKEQEINDFYEYWSIKLPPSQSYCVYPQFTRNNERAYKLEIIQKENLPVKMTRVTFMVATEESLKDKLNKKFRHPPLDSLKYLDEIKDEASRKSSAIELREWAVAFLGASS